MAAERTGKNTAWNEVIKENEAKETDAYRKAVLVVSFGTTYREQREKAIGAVERAVGRVFPGWEIRRAFTSQMIINSLKQQGEQTENVKEALERLKKEGFQAVAVQPTHVMSGLEYEKMVRAVKPYKDSFEYLCCGLPLLSSDSDFEKTAKAVERTFKAYSGRNTAAVCMGHGTDHEANQVYEKLERCFRKLGMEHFFIGTVEAEPSLKQVLSSVKEGKYKNAVLLPLMLVAGDHAHNDMAGKENSWKQTFEREGIQTECILKGLGECEEIQQIFADHARQAAKQGGLTEINL